MPFTFPNGTTIPTVKELESDPSYTSLPPDKQQRVQDLYLKQFNKHGAESYSDWTPSKAVELGANAFGRQSPEMGMVGGVIEEYLRQPLRRGVAQGEMASAGLEAQGVMRTAQGMQEQLGRGPQQQAAAEQYMQTPQVSDLAKRMQVAESKLQTEGDVYTPGEFWKNPTGNLAKVALQSMTAMATRPNSPGITSFTNPALAAVSGSGLEMGLTFVDEMRKAGMDPSDPENIKRWLAGVAQDGRFDPSIFYGPAAEAEANAFMRGITIGFVEGGVGRVVGSVGDKVQGRMIANQVAKNALTGATESTGQAVARNIARVGSEAGAEAIGGGAGEMAAQTATQPGKYDWGEIGLEAGAGFPQTIAAEVGRAGFKAVKPKVKEAISKAVEDIAPPPESTAIQPEIVMSEVGSPREDALMRAEIEQALEDRGVDTSTPEGSEILKKTILQAYNYLAGEDINQPIKKQTAGELSYTPPPPEGINNEASPEINKDMVDEAARLAGEKARAMKEVELVSALEKETEGLSEADKQARMRNVPQAKVEPQRMIGEPETARRRSTIAQRRAERAKAYSEGVKGGMLAVEDQAQDPIKNESRPTFGKAEGNQIGTLEEFTQTELNKSRYKSKYEANQQQMEAFKQNALQKWKFAVEEVAKTTPLPDNVLDDYISKFGKHEFNSVFRGDREVGQSQYEPIESRLWQMPYKKILSIKNELVLPKGEVKEAHRDAVRKAYEQGKPVPQANLDAYNIGKPNRPTRRAKATEIKKTTDTPSVNEPHKVAEPSKQSTAPAKTTTELIEQKRLIDNMLKRPKLSLANKEKLKAQSDELERQIEQAEAESKKFKIRRPEGEQTATIKPALKKPSRRKNKGSVADVGGDLADEVIDRVASWFSGAGTMEAALKNVKSVHAVEFTPSIIEQYNISHGTNYTARSIVEIDPEEVIKSNCDIFHASPVCKRFSVENRNRAANDIDLVSAKSIANVITKATPPIVTVENVPQYATSELLNIITDALDSKGYKWDVQIFDAADYGGAQTRKRMLLRAVLDGDLPPLPKKTGPSDWFSLIGDLLPQAEDSTIPDWEMSRIEKMVENGELDPKKPIITMGGSTDKTRASARNSGGPAPTLKSSPGEVPRVLLPNGLVKRITSRMMARLMGLPDSYKVPLNSNQAKTVLGNGMHGAMTKALIQPLLDKNRKFKINRPDTTKPRDNRPTRLKPKRKGTAGAVVNPFAGKPDAREKALSELYPELNSKQKESITQRVTEQMLDIKNDIRDFVAESAESLLTPIKDRLRRILPRLYKLVMSAEFDKNKKSQASVKEQDPFIRGIAKMPAIVQQKAQYAARNGDSAAMRKIAETYGLLEEYIAARISIERLLEESRDSGLDVNDVTVIKDEKGRLVYGQDLTLDDKIQALRDGRMVYEYWPRNIKDYNALRKAMGRNEVNDFERALEKEVERRFEQAVKEADEKSKGFGLSPTELKTLRNSITLSPEEEAKIATDFIRGYGEDKISARTNNFFQKRLFNEISENLQQYYTNPFEEITNFTRRVHETVAMRRMLGLDKEKNPGITTDDAIGDLIAKMPKGSMTTKQLNEIKTMLGAYIKNPSQSTVLQYHRGIETIANLGSVLTTVAQLSDIALTMLDNGQLFELYAPLRDALKNKSKVSLSDIGTEDTISFELMASSRKGGLRAIENATDKVLRASGMKWLDRVGKETIINATLAKFQREVRQGKPSKDLNFLLDNGFTDAEKQMVLNQLKQGKMDSALVQYLGFLKVSELQPVSPLNMPSAYLAHPNLRPFYMFKAFGLNRLAYMRNKIFDQNANTGDRVKELLRLSAIVALSEAPGLALRNILAGKWRDKEDAKEDWDEFFLDLFFKSVNLSRYSMNSLFRGDASVIDKAFSIGVPLTSLSNVIKDAKVAKAFFTGKAGFWESLFKSKSLGSLGPVITSQVPGLRYSSGLLKLVDTWLGNGKEGYEKRREKMFYTPRTNWLGVEREGGLAGLARDLFTAENGGIIGINPTKWYGGDMPKTKWPDKQYERDGERFKMTPTQYQQYLDLSGKYTRDALDIYGLPPVWSEEIHDTIVKPARTRARDEVIGKSRKRRRTTRKSSSNFDLGLDLNLDL